MKIHIIMMGNDHTQQIMERMKGFLRPVCEKQGEPITICMGYFYAGDEVSMEQLRDCIRAWLRDNAADFILFYGNDSGSQLGRMIGAELGFYCYNQCTDLQWSAEKCSTNNRHISDDSTNFNKKAMGVKHIDIREESAESGETNIPENSSNCRCHSIPENSSNYRCHNIPEVYVRRKIYSAHGDGIFEVSPGRTVLIVSPNGERAAVDELGANWQQETPLNWFGCSITLINQMIAADFYPDIHLVRSEMKEAVQDISSARLVLVGGKGLKTKENYQRLKQLARNLQAVCACTRPAAMSGWADFAEVVGISGASLQAEVCVTFGVSGAAPFLYGIENVKHVIAINTDPNAPIYARADYGIAEDGVKLLSDLETQIAEGESL